MVDFVRDANVMEKFKEVALKCSSASISMAVKPHIKYDTNHFICSRSISKRAAIKWS